ncbi:MAG TPA: DUF1997 domain-containing protein [Chloroflexaceae bacterium]|nr:DUF1997 domain-containing protein [Chloroflexaceae bacterium]
MSARQLRTPALQVRGRYIDLGGQATHTFRFAAPLALAYDYFCDVPAVFRLLPDALDCYPYGPDRYRLIVGATDGHGHSMAAIFDLRAHHEPGVAISLVPADDGPPHRLSGIVFKGTLAAEALFAPRGDATAVEYTVEIDMSIPVPGVLALMPTSFLQALGERTMEFKMAQMIGGFTRGITADFHAWAAG